MNAGNVTRLPTPPNETRNMVRVEADYMKRLYFRDGWKTLADFAATLPDVSPSMRKFVHNMASAKKRPTNKQIATLLGVAVSAMLEETFNRWDSQAAALESADVVSLSGAKKSG